LLQPIRTVLPILILLSIPGALAKPDGPIHVLVMHWYDRAYPANDEFDRTLQAALQSSVPGGVEYYSEYLGTLPGDDQARLLSDYLRQVCRSKDRRHCRGVSQTLDFLLVPKALFPNIPIVFATERPLPEGLASQAGATGFVLPTLMRRPWTWR
jgi:hypothetical protein